MRTVAVFLLLIPSLLAAQPTSTRCQAEEVQVAMSTIDLRLVGCGEGFPDNLLWHLDRADSLTGALDSSVTRTVTGKGAVVYLLDTGVMRDHDEFMRATGSVVIGTIPHAPDNSCGAGKDPALEPCYTSDGTLFIFTHGTATASVVAGKNTGVAPDAKIVSVDMSAAGQSIDSWIGVFNTIIRHAFDPATPQFHTGIISMSFVPNYASAKDPKFPTFEAKVRQMIGGVDVNGNSDPAGKRFLFVTTAGNYYDTQGNQCDANKNSNLFPGVLGSSIDGLITVGGIDETNHLWAGSCRGDAIDILAPAANMFVASISGRDHYRSGKVPAGAVPGNSGTSYSAPFVAGLAALLLEKNPDYTPVELERIIKSTSSRVAGGESTAGGRVAMFDLISQMKRRRVTHR